MLHTAELSKTCKYSEAIALLPSAEDYPDKADEISRMDEELARRQAKYEELMQDL